MRWNDRITLILVVLLTGCATSRTVGLPPADLLQDCGIVLPKPRTNGELAKQHQALKADLAACNRDKALLRDWAKDQK